MFVQAINEARERVWIASPYFAPDLQILSALKLAALRGYDSLFIKEVETMLSNDFDRSQPATMDDYTHRPFLFKLAVRSARLLAPIL